MKKNWFVLLTAVLLLMTTVALADDGLGSLVAPNTAVSDIPAAAQADDAVLNAVKAELPDVTIDYVLQEYDDGRIEWEVVYRTPTGGLGSCTVRSSDYAVREIRTYDNVPADALTVEGALDVLRAEMGAITLIELDVDYDDGYLCYDGEVELDGKRYEFEITVSGRIIEWSRD